MIERLMLSSVVHCRFNVYRWLLAKDPYNRTVPLPFILGYCIFPRNGGVPTGGDYIGNLWELSLGMLLVLVDEVHLAEIVEIRRVVSLCR